MIAISPVTNKDPLVIDVIAFDDGAVKLADFVVQSQRTVRVAIFEFDLVQTGAHSVQVTDLIAASSF